MWKQLKLSGTVFEIPLSEYILSEIFQWLQTAALIIEVSFQLIIN
jgi:hypothetical protein